MLLSLSLILIVAFLLAGVFNRLHIPGLLGMITAGILLGPQVFDRIDPKILLISADLREIALIVILMRAGLSIDLTDLKKVGRPAVWMSFVPALFEITAITLLGPLLLGLSLLDAALLGTVVAAVSPAVIVPRMLDLMESGYGREKRIPQLIMAGASVDDIFVIVLFSALLGLRMGEGFEASTLLAIPVSLFLGAAFGALSGWLLVRYFQTVHLRDTAKVLILLSAAFLFVSLEKGLVGQLAFSGLIAVMALGIAIREQYPVLAKRLKGKFSKIWVGAEVLLFVLVGAAVDLSALGTAGLGAVALVLLALLFRVLGVHLSLLRTSLLWKERAFCMIAYTPKATVQAAIGAVPLVAGVASGEVILSVAVLSIFLTAPFGALGIDYTHTRWLEQKQ